MRVFLITPVFPPQKGGAAQDFGYLSQIFQSNEKITEILVLSRWMRRTEVYRKRGKVRLFRILNYKVFNEPVLSSRWNTLVIQHFVNHFIPHLIIFHSIILPNRENYANLFCEIGEAKLYLYKTDLFPVPYFPRLNGIVYIAENIGRMLQRQEVPREKLIYIPILFKPPLLNKEQIETPLVSFKYILSKA